MIQNLAANKNSKKSWRYSVIKFVFRFILICTKLYNARFVSSLLITCECSIIRHMKKMKASLDYQNKLNRWLVQNNLTKMKLLYYCSSDISWHILERSWYLKRKSKTLTLPNHKKKNKSHCRLPLDLYSLINVASFWWYSTHVNSLTIRLISDT